jgi:hypothetical protein
MKLPHRAYMVSFSRAALKPLERLAFIELAMYAFTQANHQLIDNDVVLAGWAGVSVKQWLAMKPAVFMEWQQVDGHWQLPAWFVIPDAPTPIGQQAAPAAQAAQPSNNGKGKSAAERQRAYRARNKQGNGFTGDDAHHNDSNENNCDTVTRDVTEHNASDVTRDSGVTDTVTGSDVTRNGDVTESVTRDVTNEGGKGGDLDLNPDLDLDKKQKKQRDANATASRVLSSQALEIFEHWKKVFSKRGDVIFSEKRKGKVLARLNQGYTIDQIKQAIDNCAKSEFHVTNHYTDLELICRDPEHMDKFIDYVPPPPAPAKPQQPAGQQSYCASEEPADHQEYSDGITYGQLRQSMRAGETYQICFTRLITLQRLKPAERDGFLLLETVKPGVTVEDVRILAKANEVTFIQAVTFLREQIEMELEPS